MAPFELIGGKSPFASDVETKDPDDLSFPLFAIDGKELVSAALACDCLMDLVLRAVCVVRVGGGVKKIGSFSEETMDVVGGAANIGCSITHKK